MSQQIAALTQLSLISNIGKHQDIVINGETPGLVTHSLCDRIKNWILRNLFCYKPRNQRFTRVATSLQTYYNANINLSRCNRDQLTRLLSAVSKLSVIFMKHSQTKSFFDQKTAEIHTLLNSPNLGGAYDKEMGAKDDENDKLRNQVNNVQNDHQVVVDRLNKESAELRRVNGQISALQVALKARTDELDALRQKNTKADEAYGLLGGLQAEIKRQAAAFNVRISEQGRTIKDKESENKVTQHNLDRETSRANQLHLQLQSEKKLHASVQNRVTALESSLKEKDRELKRMQEQFDKSEEPLAKPNIDPHPAQAVAEYDSSGQEDDAAPPGGAAIAKTVKPATPPLAPDIVHP